jgi:hypothetical protein
MLNLPTYFIYVVICKYKLKGLHIIVHLYVRASKEINLVRIYIFYGLFLCSVIKNSLNKYLSSFRIHNISF